MRRSVGLKGSFLVLNELPTLRYSTVNTDSNDFSRDEEKEKKDATRAKVGECLKKLQIFFGFTEKEKKKNRKKNSTSGTGARQL